MLWMSEPDGQVSFVSKGLADYFGVPKEDFLGEGWVSIFYPDDIEGFYASFDPEAETYNAETQVRNKNGEIRWIMNAGHRRYSRQGEFLGFIGTITDITDRKEAM